MNRRTAFEFASISIQLADGRCDPVEKLDEAYRVLRAAGSFLAADSVPQQRTVQPPLSLSQRTRRMIIERIQAFRPPLPLPEAPPGEWLRPKTCFATFGITRAMLYLLAKRGEIELLSLKRPGSRRGITLVNAASVRAMIERHR